MNAGLTGAAYSDSVGATGAVAAIDNAATAGVATSAPRPAEGKPDDAE
jgi:hypothetical protein